MPIITPALINALQVTATEIADNTITDQKIQNETIQADSIANGTITDQKIQNGTILGQSIAAATITGTLIAGAAITASRLRTGTGTDEVNTDEIPEGSSNQYYTDAKAIAAVENEPTLDLSGQVTVTGNTADKTTTIGDYDVLGLYDSTGIQVEADETSWAGISLVEYEGGSSKPVPNFANPFFNAEVWGGSPGSETAVSSGKRLLAISGTGSEDTGSGIVMPTTAPARMIIETTEQQTSSGRGTKMYIQTTPTGSTTRSTTAEFQGDATTLINLIASGTVVFSNLPTTDPVNAGQLWNDSGTLKISAG